MKVSLYRLVVEMLHRLGLALAGLRVVMGLKAWTSRFRIEHSCYVLYGFQVEVLRWMSK